MPSKKICPEGDTQEGGASSKRGHNFMEGRAKIFLSQVPYSLLFFCFHSNSPPPSFKKMMYEEIL